MGVCASRLSAEDRAALDRSRKIDQIMVTSSNEGQNNVKLLLLGAGESGKSTILKQMKILFGNGFTDAERYGYRKFVWGNLLETFKNICEGIQALGLQEQLLAKAECDFFLTASLMDELTPAMGASMEALWADPACQQVWDRRSQFQVIDSVPAYLQRIHDITSPNYSPTDEDVLLARVRSTGVTEQKFLIDNVNLTIFDVGGQRNERRKWIHCFDEVTAVIFVAALNEFDQSLFEDEAMNRMTEAIGLFDEICNSRWFVNTDMILFLNKDDLFREKIARVNVSTVPDFEDYTGTPYSYEEGVQYFLGRFAAVSKNPDKDIFHHVTCGIDTQKFEFVFRACKEIIFKKQLGGLGFVN